MAFTDVNPELFIPFLIFSIPIIAIMGGITAGIVKIVGRQRLIELAHRERIAAIERGIDPSKLPPLHAAGLVEDESGVYLPAHEYSRRRSQNLMVAGVIVLAAGIGLAFFLSQVDDNDRTWAVGVIPTMVGIALLLSAWIVRPRSGDRPPGTPHA